ncbi:branched-chain amino acid ABC transporter permease [Propionivibrio dicarboxylicus]|uniref:Amino acid/amide ABC transporter membrane protein 1, HAAT family n=1 Tax=Propionivibrio dicarboxylicus TaxID=83767 RepID=A0A1G8E3T8_9RHOO|nr:branched-chain amino acid ABC transporter permease LivH [Propionivibrio dicarboxylicus]SDH64588.1 amino acid/amide ABC transporter membrane protein 1, HAAT family [Propionivibrio dicarboxylicus]
MDYQYLLELFCGGVVKGSLYALIALGYTMVYGIIQLINFAHGEIYMIGAFVAFIVAGILTFSGYSGLSVLLLAAIVSVLYVAAYGFTLEKIAYRPLRHAPRLSPLISAIGASIFLTNYVQLVQTPDFLPFPELIPEFEFMADISSLLSSADLVILVVTALTMIALTVLIKFTRIGKAMRATQQDMIMARLVGINVDRVISWTFIIGSILAAIAGVLIGSRSGQINAAIGFMAGIKAFTAAVLGGIGNIPGAVLGGLLLGIAETFGAGYISSAYEDVFAFALLVIVLTLRPAGLLGKATKQKV